MEQMGVRCEKQTILFQEYVRIFGVEEDREENLEVKLIKLGKESSIEDGVTSALLQKVQLNERLVQ